MLKYERKLLKFWIQSFLLGVPKIVVGFRSQNGILRRLDELETKKIPSNVKRQGKGTWDGHLCINFTAAFLECEGFPTCDLILTKSCLGLRQTITIDGVWRVRRREKSPVIEVFKREEYGHGEILSPEFVEWRKGRDAVEADVKAANSSLMNSINKETGKP